MNIEGAAMNNWDYTVHGIKEPLNNDDLTFEQTRDQVVAAFKANRWHRRNEEVRDLVEDLAGADDVESFDAVLGDIYDVADWDRAWIA